MAFTIASKRSTQNNNRAAQAEDDEFAGLWINVGVPTEVDPEEAGDEVSTKFVRLPRGIAVSDLKEHKVYASTNPDWAAEATLVNQIINIIREKGSQLAEGESVPINLSVQLYRRQEQVEAAPSKAADPELAAKLFEV